MVKALQIVMQIIPMYRTLEMIVRDKTKTLLIGSSILKGIHARGLNPEVDISTNPGADLEKLVTLIHMQM